MQTVAEIGIDIIILGVPHHFIIVVIDVVGTHPAVIHLNLPLTLAESQDDIWNDIGGAGCIETLERPWI